MKYVFPMLLSILVYSAKGFANDQEYLNEEPIENTLTVAVLDNATKDPKQWQVIAFVNGKVMHGDRLRIRFVPTGGQPCRYGNTFTYFYAVTGNQETVNLRHVTIPAEFKHEPIQVQILFAQPFLLGYAIFIDLGWNSLEELRKFFQDEKDVTLTLKDSEHVNIAEYFDMPQETWSLKGFNEALERAKHECERIVKVINPENIQQEPLLSSSSLTMKKIPLY